MKDHVISIRNALLGGAVAAMAGLGSGGGSAAEPVKNVVLVHGAFADGSGWRPVYDRLVAKGFNVTMVQEPETGLGHDVEATRRVIAQQDGPVVLVGHSWGGQIVTDAGDDPKVKALVHVAAIVPEAGESTTELHAKMPAAGAPNVREVTGGYLMIDPAHFAEAFAGDLPKADAEFMARSQVLIAKTSLEAPARVAAWKTKPGFGIIQGADRTINPELQRWMQKRAGLKTTEVAGSSHVVMISHPDVVAKVIEEAAGR